MSIESTENRIKAVKQELAKIEADFKELKERDSDPRFKPLLGEDYFYIDDCLNVYACKFTNLAEGGADWARIISGMVKETREQAGKHALRLNVFNNLWALADAMEGSGENRGCMVSFDSDNGEFEPMGMANIYGIPKFDGIGIKKVESLIGKDKIKEAWGNE